VTLPATAPLILPLRPPPDRLQAVLLGQRKAGPAPFCPIDRNRRQTLIFSTLSHKDQHYEACTYIESSSIHVGSSCLLVCSVHGNRMTTDWAPKRPVPVQGRKAETQGKAAQQFRDGAS
jgi:hypothetical protein